MSSLPSTVRVLHVDDEPDFADVAATFVEQEDDRFEVDTTTSASDGLERLATTEFDCIVSDYDMPGTDGIEFLKTVRETHPDLPFILYTGKGSEEVASDAISAGVTEYLQKETGTSQYTVLANRIMNAVSQVRAEQQLKEERYRFQTLFDRLSQATVEVEYQDGEPIVERVNPVFEDTFGYEADDIVGNCLDDYIVPDDRTDEAANINQRVQDGTSLESVEVTRQTATGTRRFLLQNAVYDDGSGGFAIYTDITKRKQREEKLVQYKTYLEETSDTIAVVNPDGTIGFHNTSGQSSLSPFDVEGENGFEYIHPEDREQMRDLFTTVLEDGTEEVTAELRVETADDEWQWIEARGVNRLDDPAIEGIIISSHEITERKNREQDLERTSELLRHTQELAGVGGWEVDIETGQQVWTRETYAIHDLDPNKELNQTVESGIEFYHPEDRAEIDRLVTQCMEEGEPYDTKLRLRTAEDRLRWVRTAGEPVREGESITSIRGAIQDITEQQNYEQTLYRLIERTDELIDETNEANIAKIAVEIASDVINASLAGVHFLTEDGEHLEAVAANDNVGDTIGFPPVYSRTESSAASDIVFQVFDQGEPLYIKDTENYGTLADETLVESGIIRPLGNHGVLIISKTNKNAFNETDRHLIDLVAQSVTAALNRAERENELQASQQQLQQERDRLDEFASIISHDLRNPLNVAMGRTDLAIQECDSEHLTDVVDALSRMKAMIDHLLLLARQGKTVGETEQVVFDPLISGCWDNVETGDATLSTEVEATLAADRDRLTQVLENLFRNAMDHGGESVTVTVGGLDDENGFYVADNGVGIPQEDRENVFDNGFSTSQDGTGFGLAIVKRICEAHDWEVSVTESETGGARFEITGIESLDS